MPKTPILNRELFYTKLRNGSYRLLDFCLVNTSIGGMVEPRSLNATGRDKTVNNDPYDMSFTSVRELDENTFYALHGSGGHQMPLDYHAA